MLKKCIPLVVTGAVAFIAAVSGLFPEYSLLDIFITVAVGVIILKLYEENN